MVRVTHYLRRPQPGVFSVERLYEDVRAWLPADIQVSVCVNRFLSRGLFRRLYDLCRAIRYRSEINHVTGDVHYLTYLLPRRRTLLTILDCVALERTRGIKHWLLWFLWYWLPEKRCGRIVVISEATRQSVLRYLRCDPDKIRVIYIMVSDEFQPSPKSLAVAQPTLLHIGITPNKNLERHAAALEGSGYKLIIVGRLSEAQRAVLLRYDVEYENYMDLDRAALVKLYQQCDALLFASTYEGFGLPIIEAQAVGRPVITSNLWSMPEVAGGAACLVDPFDVTSIRAGIDRVFGDMAYREELIDRGFENVKRFAPSIIAGQYAELYREMAKR